MWPVFDKRTMRRQLITMNWLFEIIFGNTIFIIVPKKASFPHHSLINWRLVAHLLNYPLVRGIEGFFNSIDQCYCNQRKCVNPRRLPSLF